VQEASVARNTAFGAANQITTAVFTAAVTLYLVRELGSSDYGIFALALGIATLLTLVADFGISASAARFVAERRGIADEVRSVVSRAARVKLLAALAVSGALALLAEPIAQLYDTPDLAWPLRGMAIALLAQSMFLLFTSVFVALRRVSITWRLTALESFFEAAAIVALVALGAGAAGAAFGRAIGYAIGAVAGGLACLVLLGRGPPAVAPDRGLRRRLMGYAGALFVVDLAYVFFEQADVLLIGALLSTEDVGLFEAPMRLVVFLGFAGQALAFAVAPRLAHHPDRGPDIGLLSPSIRGLALLHGALIVPLIVWAQPIVELILGPGYEGSAAVLRGLAPFAYLVGIGTLVTLGVNYLGYARRRVALAVATVLLNVVLDLVLLSEIGVVGAAIGTDVAFAFYVLGHLWICRQVAGLRTAPLLRSGVASLMAGGAMAAVLAAFGTSTLSAWEWVAGGVLGLCAYAAALAVLGEVRRRDVIAAGQAAARRLKRSEPDL
jgi:O-antigen/teichoic acid export membrane protein